MSGAGCEEKVRTCKRSMAVCSMLAVVSGLGGGQTEAAGEADRTVAGVPLSLGGVR